MQNVLQVQSRGGYRYMIAHTFLRPSTSACAADEWQRRGQSSAGMDIWERSFSHGPDGDAFLVTLFFQPTTRQSQVIVTVRSNEGDKVPRIPGSVRRATEAFRRALEATA